VRRPTRRLQAKAKAIVAVGLAVSLSIAPLVLLVILTLMAGLAEALGLHGIPFGFLILGLGTLFICAIPAYFLCAWALRLPRIVRLQCSGCGWSETFFVDKAGKVIADAPRTYA
jgi:hypothetical protein